MPNKHAEATYKFHKDLNRSFKDTHALLSTALPIMQNMVKSDRIYFFNWQEEEQLMSLSFLCKDERCMDMQENISMHTLPFSKDKLLENKIADSDDLSYPALYVLLQWQTPTTYSKEAAEYSYKPKLGVLRFERFENKKKFSRRDKEFILGLAEELSQNLLNTAVDQENAERLRVATGLNELASIFVTSLRFDDGIELILKGVQKYFRFDRARLYLFDYKGERVRGCLSVDISGAVVHDYTEMSVGALDKIVNDGIFKGSKAVNLPLGVQGKKVGVLLLDNLLSRREVSNSDYLHIKQFSSQIALAIDNTVLFERVQDLYNYDELTKLPVRRFFMEKLGEEIYRSKRFDLTMSLIIMDIDWFKEINDTFGHKVGDYALTEVSSTIMRSLRQTDFPCRFGGDEILIMLPRTNSQEAKYIAKRLGERIAAITLPKDLTAGKNFSLSVSQGISVFPSDSQEIMDLINKADKALYAAKKKQRGTFVLYREIEQSGI